MTYDADHEGGPPWTRQKDEPARGFAIFEAYLRTSPRSIRKALAIVQHEEGREPALYVPGGVIRQSILWSWKARAAAFDEHRRKEEKAAFDARCAAARRRRLAQLDKLNDALGLRLEEIAEKATLEGLLKLHAAEREEFGEDGAEDRPTGSLPAIDDVIKPLE